MSATTGGMASGRDPLRASGVRGPETRDLLAALLSHCYLAAALRRTGQQAEADSHLARARALDPRLDALPVTPEGTPSGRGAFSQSGTGSTP